MPRGSWWMKQKTHLLAQVAISRRPRRLELEPEVGAPALEHRALLAPLARSSRRRSRATRPPWK